MSAGEQQWWWGRWWAKLASIVIGNIPSWVTLYGAVAMKLFTKMFCALAVAFSCPIAFSQPPVNNTKANASTDLFKFELSGSKNGVSFTDFGSTLSRTGTELLINDPHGKGILLVDVNSLKKAPEKLPEHLYMAWFDSESDLVFGLQHRKPYSTDREKNLLNPKLEMCCFKDTKDLIANLPIWTSTSIGPVRWFASSKRFVRVNSTAVSKTPTVDVFDETGGDLKSFSVQGPVLGVDEDDSGLQIIYYVGKGRNTVIHLASLTWTIEQKKKVKLGSFPNANVLQGWGFQDKMRLYEGTRFIRVRGLKKGDVIGYYTDVLTNPGILRYSDYESLPNNPLNQLTPQHRRSLFPRGTSAPINQRSAAEDASTFEFFSVSSGNEVCFLANHQGTVIAFDVSDILDAVRIENRWLFVRLGEELREGTLTRDLILTQVEVPEDSSYSE